VLSSDSDDSLKKICLKASSILFAARLRIVFMLAFISWNENNNGFDLVGLDFFFSEYRRVAFYFILLLYFVSSFWLLVF
jgi:hypothetical protein